MNSDILTIKTLPNHERIGIRICLIDRVYPLSNQEYSLEHVDSLPDGDYPMELFIEIPYAAHIIALGEPIPLHTAKPLLRYKGNVIG